MKSTGCGSLNEQLVNIKNFGKIWVKSKSEVWRINTLWVKEPETIAWIHTFEDRRIFWDIGANIGIYSLYCAHRYPQMTIHAFEPHKHNLRRLIKNITENDHIHTTAYYAAVGRENKVIGFQQGNPEAGSSGGQVGAVKTAGSYPVWMITGDRMTTRAQACPHYIKIDTDGNEFEILLGMPKTLAHPQLKSVLIEVNSHKSDIEDLMTGGRSDVRRGVDGQNQQVLGS